MILKYALLLLCLVTIPPAFAEQPAAVEFYYKDQISHIKTRDGNVYLKPELRVQSRFSTPFETNPTSLEGLDEESSSFEINRARFKVGGHAVKPWLKIKFEYDLKNSTLLDARITLAQYEAFQFRFGRMKAHYNPERVTSSKDMTLAERSMVNDYFTLDRQQGVSLLGRLDKGGTLDSNYWIDVFNGTGRTEGNDNTNVMLVGRYQWNLLGEKLDTAMSDLARRQQPAAYIAVAASENSSRYSGFNSDGGRQLPGFVDYGLDDQYDIEQWMLDGKYHYNGFSLQGEYHQKDVEDTVTDNTTAMRGWFIQSGFFPSSWLPSVPPQLELTARYATVDTDNDGTELSETLLGMNWYFFGHRNKITADIGQYEVDEPLSRGDELRFRLQYDLSF
ncbi:porin [Oceanicoccus sagamiensis]|uniref:Porin n=1 Tax=Oceanicoccus sagamiensis TaxID=716816 RepID=A0A1X9NBQ2_9GAMM|nr:porin [Oceanicoccus sagamiensis]ARN75478.1 hypothetical protein BST96_15990 [Oceanicoccus sagamiensis]